MILRIRAAIVAALSTVAFGALAAPGAHANVLSLLGGNCGVQQESQPFAQWGDHSEYTPVPGGSFESGTPSWLLTGGATPAGGNESYHVNSPSDSRSLSIPSGGSAISLPSCTNLGHPTARLFVRNTGSAASRLTVQALYPGLLGGVSASTIGVLSGTSQWAPSPTMSLTLDNLLATLSLDRTVIAFRFIPSGSGAWSVDDVYIDPWVHG